MSDLIFGTDLDDCILTTSKSIFSLMKLFLCNNIQYEDIKSYNLENYISKDNHHILTNIVSHVLNNTNAIGIEKNAISILNWISTLCKHEKIYIISHRPSYLHQHTKEVLENIGLNNFELIFTYDDGVCDFIHKYEVINDRQIDIFVEDRPSTIKNIYDNTLATTLVMDKPWTRSIAENDRIYIIRNWMEIRDYFLTFTGRRECYGI